MSPRKSQLDTVKQVAAGNWVDWSQSDAAAWPTTSTGKIIKERNQIGQHVVMRFIYCLILCFCGHLQCGQNSQCKSNFNKKLRFTFDWTLSARWSCKDSIFNFSKAHTASERNSSKQLIYFKLSWGPAESQTIFAMSSGVFAFQCSATSHPPPPPLIKKSNKKEHGRRTPG